MIGIRQTLPTTMAVTSMAIAIPLYSWIMYGDDSSLETITIVMGLTTLTGGIVFIICAIIIRRKREKN